jgi:hypothetical protein
VASGEEIGLIGWRRLHSGMVKNGWVMEGTCRVGGGV